MLAAPGDILRCIPLVPRLNLMRFLVSTVGNTISKQFGLVRRFIRDCLYPKYRDHANSPEKPFGRSYATHGLHVIAFTMSFVALAWDVDL